MEENLCWKKKQQEIIFMEENLCWKKQNKKSFLWKSSGRKRIFRICDRENDLWKYAL